MQSRAVGIGDVSAQDGEHLVVDLILSEVAKGLEMVPLLRPAVAMLRGVVC